MSKGSLKQRYEEYEVPYDISASKASVFKQLDATGVAGLPAFKLLIGIVSLSAFIVISLLLYKSGLLSENQIGQTMESNENYSNMNVDQDANASTLVLDGHENTSEFIHQNEDLLEKNILSQKGTGGKIDVRSRTKESLNTAVSTAQSNEFKRTVHTSTNEVSVVRNRRMGFGTGMTNQLIDASIKFGEAFRKSDNPTGGSMSQSAEVAYSLTEEISVLSKEKDILSIDFLEAGFIPIVESLSEREMVRPLTADITFGSKSKFRIGIVGNIIKDGSSFSAGNYSTTVNENDLQIRGLYRGLAQYNFGICFQHGITRKLYLEHKLMMDVRTGSYSYSSAGFYRTEETFLEQEYSRTVITTTNLNDYQEFFENDLFLAYRPMAILEFGAVNNGPFSFSIGLGLSAVYDFSDSFYVIDRGDRIPELAIETEKAGFLFGGELSARVNLDLLRGIRVSGGLNLTDNFSTSHKIRFRNRTPLGAELSVLKAF